MPSTTAHEFFKKLNISRLYNSSLQPFWHRGPVLWKAIFLWWEVMGGRDSSGNVTSGGQMKLPLLACHSPVAHLLLCDLGVRCVGKEAGATAL